MTDSRSTVQSAQRRLGVVGLGRIGLPTAVAFTSAGWEVHGVDRDRTRLDAIRDARLPFDEPGLDADALAGLRLHAAPDDVGAAIWVICVGTNVGGTVDAGSVEAAVSDVVAVNDVQLLVIESTVPPGTCEAIAATHDVPVAHCPERAAPGTVLADIATTPRLVGGVDDRATDSAHALYEPITDAPLLRCTATVAELAKLAENASREVAIAFANELAEVARELGVDPDELRGLASTHPRVELLRPGLGVGGDCLPMATDYFARRGGGVSAAARQLHDALPRRWADRLVSVGVTRVALLGTTYKPDVRYEHDPLEERPVGPLIVALRRADIEVRPWDPSLGVELEDALRGVDLVLFGCAHRVFGELDPVALKSIVEVARFADPVGAVDSGRWLEAGWAPIAG